MPTVMQISRPDAVAVMLYCGYKSMDQKTDAELSSKMEMVPDILPPNETPTPAVKELLDKITIHAKNLGKFEVFTPATTQDVQAASTPVASAEPVATPAAVAESAPAAVAQAAAQPAEAVTPTAETQAAPKKTRKPREKKAVTTETAGEQKLAKAKRAKKEKPAKPAKAARKFASVVLNPDGAYHQAGAVLKEMGLSAGITPEICAKLTSMRGTEATMPTNMLYLTRAWMAIQGYLAGLPKAAAPVADAPAQTPAEASKPAETPVAATPAAATV